MSPRVPCALGALLFLASVTAAQQRPAAAASLDSLMRVLRLPKTTTEARTKGVPDSQVGGILDVLRRSKVPAGDAEEILRGEVEATAAGQPGDNFGAFVQAQHRAGLRGRALSDAIHAEHARRGVGGGTPKHDGDDRDHDSDDDRAARGGQGGRSDTARPGTPRSRGRPDTASASRGRSGEKERKP
jgi:hypothetical protein